MIDEVIERSLEIPPYVTRAQTGALVFPYRNTYFIHGYASDALYDAHFDLYGADNSDGYVYLFRIDPKAKHFSPYMFFKDIHTGLRKYDEQGWWREEWASKEDLDGYLWNQMALEIDEYDKSFATRGVPQMEIRSLDDLSEEGLKILELYADYANLPIEVAAQKIEHFLELRHSGLGYLPNVNENAFYSALVDLGYGGLYEWEYPEMPDLPLNFLILDPSIIESYKVVRAKDVPPNVDMGDYLHEQPWVPASFPSPLGRRNPVENTYTLYRGAPFSGLDLENLRGRGGYGQEMLGSGLYTTDEYSVASDYASRDGECVYELELQIPEDDILYVDIDYMYVSTLESSRSIPDWHFGVKFPAFQISLKDRKTGKFEDYLISESEDILENEDDLKEQCVDTVLKRHGLFSEDFKSESYADRTDIEEYLEELISMCKDFTEEDFEEYGWAKDLCNNLSTYVSTLAGSESLSDEDLEAAIIRNLTKEYETAASSLSGLPKYGESSLIWEGDSTDLANLARDLGYKVLWCRGWISSGDEIVIVDDSIYNKGLTIVDDCT